MAKEIIHLDTSDCGRLRCDNSECGYVLPEAREWGKHLIGFPCPRCSSNMLTERDYQDTEKMIRRIGWVNKIFGPWFGREYDQSDKKTWNKDISIRHHDGQVIVSDKEEDDSSQTDVGSFPENRAWRHKTEALRLKALSPEGVADDDGYDTTYAIADGLAGLSRPDAGRDVRLVLERALKFYDNLERPHAPGEAELLDAMQAALSTPSDAVNESAGDDSSRETISAIINDKVKFILGRGCFDQSSVYAAADKIFAALNERSYEGVHSVKES